MDEIHACLFCFDFIVCINTKQDDFQMWISLLEKAAGIGRRGTVESPIQ